MQKNKGSASDYRRQDGFTLMELLVVIAIIGILATIVLASLSDARDKGADASTKSNLTNARAQAEIFYNDNEYSFTGVCAAINTLVLAAAKSYDGSVTTVNLVDGAITTTTCHESTLGWAAEAPLNTGEVWCIDSSGASQKNETPLGDSTDITC